MHLTSMGRTILSHYEKLMNQRMAAPPHHHSQISTPTTSSSTTPFHTHPPSARSTPPPHPHPGPSSSNLDSQAAAYASIPVVPLIPHPNKEEYPAVKFWFKAAWTDDVSNTADKGIVKSEPSSESGFPPAPAEKSSKKGKGNKKLSFLEDHLGRMLGKDEMDQLSKAFYGLLNDLVRMLGIHYPHTWAVAGNLFQSYVINNLFNKYLVFHLGDGRWKGEEYCAVKFSDWARNGMPSAVKAEKALLKRERQEMKNRKNLPPPPPGAEVVNIDDNNTDSVPPPAKRVKTEDAPELKLTSTSSAPAQVVADIAPLAEKMEKKTRKSTLYVFHSRFP